MLGYITIQEKGASDRLLTRFARHLQEKNLPICGAIQIDIGNERTSRAEMTVEVLATGEVITISQNLGPMAAGCRLNTEALEIAAQRLADTIQGHERVLILSKFGKQERDGQGFRDVIVKALDLGIPVLLGVNESLLGAFQDFAGEFAKPLEADLSSLSKWIENPED